jgi:hypothetical protein
VVADPLLESGESFGLDAAGADPAELFGVDEAAFFEYLEMLRYGSKGDAEGGGEGGDGKGSEAETVQDGAAGGIAECVKETVDIDFTVGCRSDLSAGLGFDGRADLCADLWTDLSTDFGMGHGSEPFPAVGRLLRQLRCQVVDELAPSGFADLRAVGALEERSLMSADEVGSFVGGDEFDCDERG